MDLNKIISLQKQFDSGHNWTPKNDDIQSIVNAVNKDIIGAIGEFGEFSNIIKKINLLFDSNNQSMAEEKYKIEIENMSEEIIDMLIYIFRIIAHLNIDAEKAYLRKLSFNKEKYKDFEKNV